MRFRLIALSLMLSAAVVAGVAARQAGPAQLALEAARKTEVVDRNLLAAIVQYQDVASKFESDVTVAPAALLQLAGCYEQLHQPEARATYERIVRYYPDSAPAKTARVKLAGPREAGLTTAWLTAAPDQGVGTPFLDGRYFTLTGFYPGFPAGDVLVRDQRSRRTRALTHGAKPSAIYAVPSPNGQQIAYRWAAGRIGQLRVIDFDGSHERVVCCDDNGGAASASVTRVYGWSGDGRQVLFSVTRSVQGATALELMSILAIGGAPRSLKRDDGGLDIGQAAWSPDGQFIVYDAPTASGQAEEHDLFIMRADGSNTEPLVTNGANDQMLHWFPDGTRILFLSDRSAGSDSIFAQTIANGKAVGEPTLVKALVGRIDGQGFTRDGAYYYSALSAKTDVFTARLSESGALSGKLEPIPSRFSSGKTGGAWSPDGSQIAYVHHASDFRSGPSILSTLTVTTHEVHAIPLQLTRIGRPAWMPDGRAVIVDGATPDGASGLFRVELRDGTVTPVGRLVTTNATRYSPAVSPNGREVFYDLGDELGRSRGIQGQDLASGVLRMVFTGPTVGFAISPDGRFMALASYLSGSATDRTPPFSIVPLAGGEARALGTELAPGWQDTGFAWSADGRYLYFARANSNGMTFWHEGMALWRLPVDGGPAQQTDIPLSAQRRVLGISVRPDGLLALSTEAVASEYWVMRNIPPAVTKR